MLLPGPWPDGREEPTGSSLEQEKEEKSAIQEQMKEEKWVAKARKQAFNDFDAALCKKILRQSWK